MGKIVVVRRTRLYSFVNRDAFIRGIETEECYGFWFVNGTSNVAKGGF